MQPPSGAQARKHDPIRDAARRAIPMGALGESLAQDSVQALSLMGVAVDRVVRAPRASRQDARSLDVGADGGNFWIKLLIGTKVDRDHPVGQAALLPHDVNLVAAGRGPRIHFNHGLTPRGRSARSHSNPSMLDRLRHWWLNRQMPVALDACRRWAHAQAWAFRLAREGDGFVIEPPADQHWRLEWGASHRRYLGSHELRLRGDAGVDVEVFAVVMPRALLDALERELFQSFTEGVQTREDDSLPAEVRWLAMAERLSGAALGGAREQLAAVGNQPSWLGRWLGGGTGSMLVDAIGQSAHGTATPLSLCLHHGQVILRVGLAAPDAAQLAHWTSIFRAALAEARALADGASVP